MGENQGHFKKRAGGQSDGTVTLSLSVYEQYISHLRIWMRDYHLSFEEIERTPLAILFDLEIVDSKIMTAFERQQASKKKKKSPAPRKLSIEHFI